MSILNNEGHDPDGFGNQHTEDSEMREPARMSESELIDALDAKFGVKPAPDEPVWPEDEPAAWTEDDLSELNEALDAFTAKYGPDAPDVSRYPIDPDRAAKKEAWYARNGCGTLRIKAIAVTETVGEVSRTTRFEFEGGGPVEIFGIEPIGGHVYVGQAEPPDA